MIYTNLMIVIFLRETLINQYWKERNLKWQTSVNSLWKKHVISVLLPISMLVRRQQPNVSCTTQVRFTKLVKHTMALHKWTGWNKNKNVVLQLHQLLQRLNGKITASTSSTPQDTLTSLSKLNVPSVFLMVP